MSVYVLCIGCNYRGQSAELAGCINDAHIMGRVCELRLQHRLYAKVIMTDDRHPSVEVFPSKANIIRQLAHIVHLATTAKIQAIIVHFSGHGSWRRDIDADEQDARDETILPTDFLTAGEITDDWFLREFLQKLPATVRLFALIDACHSGTFADQRFVYAPVGRTGLKVTNRPTKARTIVGARHVVISGCTDRSYSYDAFDKEYGPSGACTVAFVRALRQSRRLDRIIRSMRATLGRRQVPQLSASMALSATSMIPIL